MTISVCDDNINELSLSLLEDCSERDFYDYLIEYKDDTLLENHFYQLHCSYEVNLRLVIDLDKKGFATIVGKAIPVAGDTFFQAGITHLNYLLSPSVRRSTL